MNRKTKKRMKIVAVVLFFLFSAAGYFWWNTTVEENEKDSVELTGVLSVTELDTSEELLMPEGMEEGKELPEELVVYVCGAVNAPGIYTLAPDSRLYEAVALAGGFSSEADPAYHNLARSISDGERIYILSTIETEALSEEQQVAGEEGTGNSIFENGLINLNTATAEQLMELPGIGEAKAKGILEYRARIGQFTVIEEIKNVSGIGEAMYEKIKDKITVK